MNMCQANGQADGHPNLGRLFLTPELRAAIDEARRIPLSERMASQTVTTIPDTPVMNPPSPGSPVKLQGIIKRNRSVQRLWLNSHTTLTSSSTDPSPNAQISTRNNAINLTLDDQRNVTLKPGQIFLPTENRIIESYEWEAWKKGQPVVQPDTSPSSENQTEDAERTTP
jgi:hypothetical protein